MNEQGVGQCPILLGEQKMNKKTLEEQRKNKEISYLRDINNIRQ
jgi:hypothetical protein